jgi:uncharacterized lipoprotein
MPVQVAWKRIATALNKSVYAVVRQDEKARTFYIDYNPGVRFQAMVYLIKVSAVGIKSSVKVRDVNNKPADSIVAKDILSAIEQKLLR